MTRAIALLFLAALGALVGLRRRSSSPAAPPRPAPSSGRPPAYGAAPHATSPQKRFAYVYQEPNQTEIRMAIGTSPRDAREMGIFGSAAMAAKVARDAGATLAWEGVRELP